MAEHRARVTRQMRLLAAEKGVLRAFPADLGGGADHGGNIAGFEELGKQNMAMMERAMTLFSPFSATRREGSAPPSEVDLLREELAAVKEELAKAKAGKG